MSLSFSHFYVPSNKVFKNALDKLKDARWPWWLLPAWMFDPQRSGRCTGQTHPHAGFQANLRHDGQQGDASLEGCWPHRPARPHGLSAHLLHLRAGCWGFSLGADYLVRVGGLREIHGVAFVGCQGDWCYVGSLKHREKEALRNTEKKQMIKDGKKKRGRVGGSLPAGSFWVRGRPPPLLADEECRCSDSNIDW